MTCNIYKLILEATEKTAYYDIHSIMRVGLFFVV